MSIKILSIHKKDLKTAPIFGRNMNGVFLCELLVGWEKCNAISLTMLPIICLMKFILSVLVECFEIYRADEDQKSARS